MKGKTAILLLVCLCLTMHTATAGTAVTSFYPIYLIALNLLDGIDEVSVVNLAPPETGCLHDYQLTTGDMRTLSEAEAFLINGAGMESYLSHVLEALPALPVADASDGIELLPDISGEMAYNAHIWLDAENAAVMAENLARRLEEVYPQHADAIQANCGAYATRLRELHQQLEKDLEPFSGQNIITFHEAFPYFAKAYGLNVAAVVTLEPGEALSPRQLADLIQTVRSLQNPPLFTEPQYQSLAAQTIAAETGAAVYELDPCVTGPTSDIPLDYYEQVMLRNRDVLVQALSQKDE